MKDAERATYSFITALEEGKPIDVKSAIQDNRGGGAVHSEKDQAIRAARLAAQQKKAADLKAAEDALIAAEAEKKAAKEAKLAAKVAAQKTDWVAGESCWAPIKGKFVFVEVVRNVPGMGVTVKTATGKTAMVT